MSESEPRHALESLAWRICVAHRQPVAIDEGERGSLERAIADGTLVQSEQGLRFADESAMIAVAAQHVLQTQAIQLLSTPKACFEGLHEIFRNEIGKQPAVSAHVLAALHNAGHLDAYTWGRQAIEAGVRVFDVLLVMEGAVALFGHARAEAIYEFFTGHYEQVKNDLFGGRLYSKLPAWLAQHADVARELKQLHEAKPQERSASLYGCTLHSLILHDFAQGFALALAATRHSEPIIAGPALHILGLVDYGNPEQCEAVERVVLQCREVVRTQGHPLVGTAVGTLGRVVNLRERPIVELLFEATDGEAPEALAAISEMLWREQKVLATREWFWPLFLHLAAARTEHKRILEKIDMTLMGWVSDPARESRVLEFLNAWITRQPSRTLSDAGVEEYFSSTFHELAGKPPLLSKTLTGWLLADDGRCPLVAQKAVSRLRAEGVTSLSLDSTLIDELRPNEIRFLLRRILGYIIGDEAQIHLVFSLARSRDAKERTFQWITTVLRDEVGYDFPHQTIEFLKERQSAEDEPDDVKGLCGDIAAALQADLDALDALPHIKEFRPTSAKAHRFAKERGKQLNKAFDEASKESIWRQLVTNVVLKAGRRTFQTIKGHYTEPMELKSMSHAVALPRSETCDPARAARKRLLYRKATRDTP